MTGSRAMPPRFKQATEGDRPMLLIVLAIMVVLILAVGIVPAVMPARA